MKTITVYEYDELPTEEAKTRAREWWARLEEEDPAWMEEHSRSLSAAQEACKGMTSEDLPRIIRQSENCEFTGYCADAFLADLIKERSRLPTWDEIHVCYVRAWEAEIAFRTTDREHIEESIRANEYAFFADGTRCTQ